MKKINVKPYLLHLANQEVHRNQECLISYGILLLVSRTYENTFDVNEDLPLEPGGPELNINCFD